MNRVLGRPRWPRRLAGLLVFAAVASSPWDLASSGKAATLDVRGLDPEVEGVLRYLDVRAPTSLPPELRRQIAAAVVGEARASGLDPLYVLAVIEVESDFDPAAVSAREAHGLMQLRSVTERELARNGLALPGGAEEPAVVNVRHGVRYLAWLEKRYGSRERALAAWNAGPGAVDRAILDTGSVPGRWLSFARRVEQEHQRLRATLATGTLFASAEAPPGLARRHATD